MSNRNFHGMKRPDAMSALCSRDSLNKERVGRFGRMFKGQQPLYTDPATLIALGSPDGPMDSMGIQPKTGNVPLGMIFFGQFIDHDVTLDTTSKLNAVNQPGQIENFRTPALDLDCVFGEGPEDEPFLFEKKSRRMLTGATNKNHGQLPSLRKLDLPRNGEGTAMIGDPRNDENRIISQLQLAFIQAYNAIYANLEGENPSFAPSQLYELARRELTNNYHWIILHEFLPTLCGTKTAGEVLYEGRRFYKPCQEPFIPVEFSAAAYRFGHGMIAQNMRLQPGGPVFELFSPQLGFGFAPIANHDEVVDWSAFFDFDGQYQRASQLSPKLAPDLLELPFIPPPQNSLAARNLLRAQSFLLPSGETIAQCMGRPQGEIQAVRDYVMAQISANNIELKGGTPLWYYLLCEAQAVGKQDLNGNKPGEGLGPVGATIVAEVMMGLIELDSHSFMATNRNWQPRNGSFSMKDLLEMRPSPRSVEAYQMEEFVDN